MKVEFLEQEASFKIFYIVHVSGEWHELRDCANWIKRNFGTETNGGYLIRYLENGRMQTEKDFYTKYSHRKYLHIRFNNEENAMAFKLAFEE